MLPAAEGEVHLLKIHLDLTNVEVYVPVQMHLGYHPSLEIRYVVRTQQARALIDMRLLEERHPPSTDTVSVLLVDIPLPQCAKQQLTANEPSRCDSTSTSYRHDRRPWPTKPSPDKAHPQRQDSQQPVEAHTPTEASCRCSAGSDQWLLTKDSESARPGTAQWFATHLTAPRRPAASPLGTAPGQACLQALAWNGEPR